MLLQHVTPAPLLHFSRFLYVGGGAVEVETATKMDIKGGFKPYTAVSEIFGGFTFRLLHCYKSACISFKSHKGSAFSFVTLPGIFILTVTNLLHPVTICYTSLLQPVTLLLN